MNNQQEIHLHSLERAKVLDSRFRMIFHNPRKILRKYIKSGMTVLDLGCGTGYFTLELAKLVGIGGKVVALDVQAGMLEILKQKIQHAEFTNRIQICQNQENSIDLMEKFDFVLIFYSFHEMKYKDEIINELTTIVTPETRILISEQKMHVSKYSFDTTINKMEQNGFQIIDRPKIFLSRTVLMKLN